MRINPGNGGLVLRLLLFGALSKLTHAEITEQELADVCYQLKTQGPDAFGIINSAPLHDIPFRMLVGEYLYIGPIDPDFQEAMDSIFSWGDFVHNTNRTGGPKNWYKVGSEVRGSSFFGSNYTEFVYRSDLNRRQSVFTRFYSALLRAAQTISLGHFDLYLEAKFSAVDRGDFKSENTYKWSEEDSTAFSYWMPLSSDQNESIALSVIKPNEIHVRPFKVNLGNPSINWDKEVWKCEHDSSITNITAGIVFHDPDKPHLYKGYFLGQGYFLDKMMKRIHRFEFNLNKPELDLNSWQYLDSAFLCDPKRQLSDRDDHAGNYYTRLIDIARVGPIFYCSHETIP